jgi:hypothetical protein
MEVNAYIYIYDNGPWTLKYGNLIKYLKVNDITRPLSMIDTWGWG